MSKKTLLRQKNRTRRKARIRARIIGTARRPRLCVYRSLRFITVQVIDDAKGHTLFADNSKNYKSYAELGEAIAKGCQKLGVDRVVFDRGGNRYMGNIQELAEAARKQGLQF